MSIYDPLRGYLGSVDWPEVRLRFEDVERILGRSLPPSARDYDQWWDNTPGAHTQSVAWLSNGLYAKVDRRSETVTFRRTA